jgi:5-methylcytosine-specific restriction endonuclease McrA
LAKTNKEWTDARLKAFIISGLRAASRRYPPKFETLHEAKTTKKINQKTGRLAQHYMCNACKEEFPAKEIQVDHKKPVIDPKFGFVDWNTYVERMFCKKSNLQALCLNCHKKKTEKEKKVARKQSD